MIEAVGTPQQRTTTTVYDGHGNVVSVFDGRGKETDYSYDGLNRQIAAKDASGARVTTTYDGDNNVLTVTDPTQNVTAFSYDDLNRKVGMTDALQHSAGYSYDGNDNLVAATDRNGRKRAMAYDQLDRLVEEQWYDANGNLTLTTSIQAGNLAAHLSHRPEVLHT